MNFSTLEQPTLPPPYPDVNYTPNISITLSAESIQIVEVGSTVRLHCSAHYIHQKIPVYVRWIKIDGTLSSRTVESEGVLTIRNSQADDSGVYECLASGNRETVSKNVSVIVGRKYFLFLTNSIKLIYLSNTFKCIQKIIRKKIKRGLVIII